MTVAYVAVDCVDAIRVGRAGVVTESAFVDVATSKPVAVVSEVAVTCVVPLSVDAVSISVATMTVLTTFINICTNTVNVFETIVAEAVVAAFVVDAVCMFATIRWICPQGTFVNVETVACPAAATEAVIAFAFIAADCVQAGAGFEVALVCVAFAFVKIFADNNSIADEAFVADTVVAAVIVLTCGVFVAVKGV